jgi:ABC-type glycerol-3-phosphate transport system substrate-binding protein
MRETIITASFYFEINHARDPHTFFMSKFQLIVFGVCIVAIIGGAIAFATYKGSQGTTLPVVTIWGTLPETTIDKYVQQINLSRSQQIQVNYTEVNASDFSNTFINALAKGQGPDIILIPQDMLSRYADQIVPIPYTTLTQRDFMNTYVEGSELYLGSQGVTALPLLIDPLIMYWNRDLFGNAGLPSYPQYWDEFPGLTAKLTVKDQNSNIEKSSISLGEFANVENAREIFGTLLLQLGDPVTVTTSDGLVSALGNSSAYSGEETTEAVVNYYTQFADPSSSSYSWNRALPDAESDFLAGNLGVYFGFASEISDLRAKNPNLNFDAAPLPQVRNGAAKAAYGTIYGLSIARSASSPNNAYAIMQILTDPSNLASLVSLTYLPPARRDLIGAGTTDPYLSIFYTEALIARSWADIDPEQSGSVFGSMIESVTSGAKSVSQAVEDANGQYNLLLQAK